MLGIFPHDKASNPPWPNRCSGSNGGPPKISLCPNPPGPVNATSLEAVFTSVIKSLKMRSLWISWVGHKIQWWMFLWKCTNTEEAIGRRRLRLEWCSHKPRKAWNHWKLEKTRKNSPVELLEGVWPWRHLDLDFWSPELWDMNTFLLFVAILLL